MIETDIVDSTDIICDGCNATIAHYTEDGTVRKTYFDDCFYVITGHYDWGNDSHESVEEYYFCPECMDKVFEEYKKLCLGRHNTRYIEINHKPTCNMIAEE
jgi:hypothetical protein